MYADLECIRLNFCDRAPPSRILKALDPHPCGLNGAGTSRLVWHPGLGE